MTADDQQFLQYLASVSQDVRRFSADLADGVDTHLNSVAQAIRDTLASASWLPEATRPSPRQVPCSILKRPPPPGYIERAQNWVSRNRAITAAVVAFLGTGAFLIYQQRRGTTKKRRAKRASNGARKELVVLVGSPGSPIIKSMSLDLERRGFIVYVVVNNVEDEQTVQSESRLDIRPLHLDIVDPMAVQDVIDRFHALLKTPHQAFAGALPHEFSFAGLVVAPDLDYPAGSIQSLGPEQWSDALNIKVLGTITTVQAFLPLVEEMKARVLVLTPNIVSSLQPAGYAVESAVVGALQGFTSSLRDELRRSDVYVCHLKLGSFDWSGVGPKTQLQTRDYLSTWPTSLSSIYGGSSGKATRGSHPRVLNHAVFDALTRPRPRATWRVGRGSLLYDGIGSIAPAGVVGWMLGTQRGAPVESAAERGLETSWEVMEDSLA